MDLVLRQKAKKSGHSLNDVLLEALMSGADVPNRYTDLDAFFGSWVNDEEVEKSLKEQRQIDKKIWK